MRLKLAHKKKLVRYNISIFLFEIIVKKFLLVEKKWSTHKLYHIKTKVTYLLIEGAAPVNINYLTR